METEVRSLYDDVMTLKMAIEEAIIKGQKCMDGLNDSQGSRLVSTEDFALSCVQASSGVVGWLDDF